MSDPIKDLVDEHILITRWINVLEEEVKTMDMRSKIKQELFRTVVDFFEDYTHKIHHGKEEQVLFDRLEDKRIDVQDKVIIDDLILEHVSAGIKVDNLSKAVEEWAPGESNATQYVKSKLYDLVLFYPDHMEREEKRFFEKAMKYFNDDEREEILEEFALFDDSELEDIFTERISKLEKEYDID